MTKRLKSTDVERVVDDLSVLKRCFSGTFHYSCSLRRLEYGHNNHGISER